MCGMYHRSNTSRLTADRLCCCGHVHQNVEPGSFHFADLNCRAGDLNGNTLFNYAVL